MIKKIMNSSFWLLMGTIIGRLTIFTINIFGARVLSQEVFGQYSMIRNTFAMIEGILAGTFNATATKKIAEKQNKEKIIVVFTLFFINIFFSLIIFTLIIFFSNWIVNTFFLSSEKVFQGLYIGLFLFLFSILSTLVQSFLIGIEEFKKIAFSSFISTLISFPLVIFLIYNYSFYGILLSVVIYFFIDFLFKLFILKRSLNIKLSYLDSNKILKEIKDIGIFSLPIFFSVVINSFVFWYARVLLINETKNFSEIAIFDAAFQWLTIIMLITGSTTRVALPLFSKAFKFNNKDIFNEVFIVNMKINLMISIIIGSFFIIFSQQIMSLYGVSYISKGSYIIIILSVASVFFTIATLWNRYMVSINHQKVLLIVSVLASILMYTVYFLYGVNIRGLAYSILAYYAISVLIYVIYNYLFVYWDNNNE